jgi:hypothetical protein
MSLFPTIRKVNWMAHLMLLCDDSGKFTTPFCEYITFCGFVGTGEEWRGLHEAWQSPLIKWEVPPIHMRKIARADEHEEWRKVKARWKNQEEWIQKRDEMLMEFATAASKFPIVCAGGDVDCKAFTETPLPKLKSKISDPHFWLFQWTVETVLRRVSYGGPDEGLLGILVDDDEEKAIPCYRLLMQLKKQNTKAGKRVSGICFIDDEHYPGAQLADMLAYEVRDYLWKGRGVVSPLLQTLCKTGPIHHFDKAALLILEGEIT